MTRQCLMEDDRKFSLALRNHPSLSSAQVSSRTMHIAWDDAGCLCPGGDLFNYAAPGEVANGFGDVLEVKQMGGLRKMLLRTGFTPGKTMEGGTAISMEIDIDHCQ
ncbi:hypothetical protein ACOSQ3_026873 [Xanthoceras sorbifolium]